MFTLHTDLWVPAPIDSVWDFASQPKNLVQISPPQYKVRVNFDGHTKQGSLLVIKTRIAPIPVETRWLSKIENIISIGDRRSFDDLQIEGPFKYWKHVHIFESGFESDTSKTILGTWIRDRVEYALPFGGIGEWAHKLWVKKQLDFMFAYRMQELEKIFR